MNPAPTFLTAILCTILLPLSALANDAPYTLDNSPWSERGGQTCGRIAKTGLRTYIFPPEYVTRAWPYPDYMNNQTEFIVIPERTLPDGTKIQASVRERIVPFLGKNRIYRALSTQSVGYLNDKQEWVDEKRQPIYQFDSFYVEKYEIQPPQETYANPPAMPFIDSVNDKHSSDNKLLAYKISIKNAPNCTHITIVDFMKVTETLAISNQNQPLMCTPSGNFTKQPPRLETKEISRYVIARPDGGITYLKDGNGDFQITGGNADPSLYFDKKYNGKKCNWAHLSQR